MSTPNPRIADLLTERNRHWHPEGRLTLPNEESFRNLTRAQRRASNRRWRLFKLAVCIGLPALYLAWAFRVVIADLFTF